MLLFYKIKVLDELKFGRIIVILLSLLIKVSDPKGISQDYVIWLHHTSLILHWHLRCDVLRWHGHWYFTDTCFMTSCDDMFTDTSPILTLWISMMTCSLIFHWYLLYDFLRWHVHWYFTDTCTTTSCDDMFTDTSPILAQWLLAMTCSLILHRCLLYDFLRWYASQTDNYHHSYIGHYWTAVLHN